MALTLPPHPRQTIKWDKLERSFKMASLPLAAQPEPKPTPLPDLPVQTLVG